MYKIEMKDRAKFKGYTLYRRETYVLKPKKFNYVDDVEDNDFTPLINKIVNELGSCFITGIAGSGKTTLINQLKTYMTENLKT